MSNLNNSSLSLEELKKNLREKDSEIEKYKQIVQDLRNTPVCLSWKNKEKALSIAKKVMPRAFRQKKSLSQGDESEQSKNWVIEGDNLFAMSSLYQKFGKIDLIITDPPYNTGKDFRYNDKEWYEEVNNQEGYGIVVEVNETGRHTKWIEYMFPRLQLMHKMLKSRGVLAICIDDNELFNLGKLLDEIFGEENRIAIINWQKTYSPKNQAKHISQSTEYVLVYAKNLENSKTGREERKPKTLARYKNPDNDPKDVWVSNDASAATYIPSMFYAIQSPFTGELHYPPKNCHWSNKKENVKYWLEEWGTVYEEKDIGDGFAPALLLKGIKIDKENKYFLNNPVVVEAQIKAIKKYETGPWPKLYFLKGGLGKIRLKGYLKEVKKGVPSTTYWANEDFSLPELGSISLPFKETGHSQDGVRELMAIINEGRDFIGVKPLKLFKKIIQLWCPLDGLILDPFAGTGTTGHAALDLNQKDEGNRRFILVEKGEGKDRIAQRLLAKRLKAVILGQWADKKQHQPLEGGFKFWLLGKKLNKEIIIKMEREEMIDSILQIHFDGDSDNFLEEIRQVDYNFQYLIAKNNSRQGIFLIWNGSEEKNYFIKEVYQSCVKEAKIAEISPPYIVYARLYIYQTDTVEFYKIPESILVGFGLDLATEIF